MAGKVEDPRQFLAVTRLLLYPSVWEESFGRTIVEAMINGVPVVASQRGALEEVVGMGGVVVPIPEEVDHNLWFGLPREPQRGRPEAQEARRAAPARTPGPIQRETNHLRESVPVASAGPSGR